MIKNSFRNFNILGYSLNKRYYSKSNIVNENTITEKRIRNSLYSFGSGENSRLGLTSGDTDKLYPQHVSHLPPFISIKQIGSSWLHSFLLTENGEVFMWGSNSKCNIPLPSTDTIKYPTSIDILKQSTMPIQKISIGRSFTLSLTSDEKVLSNGSNEFGQLGNGGTLNQTKPTLIETLRSNQIIDIGTGLDHAIAVSNTGHAYGWGYNVEGQIAQKIMEYTKVTSTDNNGSTTELDESLRNEYEPDVEYRTPTLINSGGLDKVKISKVFCGYDSTFLLSARGNLYAFGSNEIGQLGLGEDKKGRVIVPSKVPIPNQEKIRTMSTGAAHSLFITTGGNIYTCGWGEEGRLGLGENTTNRYEPTLIDYFKKKGIRLIKVSAGGAHSLGLTESGEVYSWGCGNNGKLGHGNETFQHTPKLIEYFKGKKVIDIHAGIDNSFVVVQGE